MYCLVNVRVSEYSMLMYMPLHWAGVINADEK